MFGIFRKDKGNMNTASNILHFKTNLDAFTYACDWLANEVTENKTLIAIIINPETETQDNRMKISAMNELGATDNVSGAHRFYYVKVAAKHGGFNCIGTCDFNGAIISPGDLVLWAPIVNDPKLGLVTDDTRSAWIGRIFAKLSPAFSIKHRSFATLESYISD